MTIKGPTLLTITHSKPVQGLYLLLIFATAASLWETAWPLPLRLSLVALLLLLGWRGWWQRAELGGEPLYLRWSDGTVWQRVNRAGEGEPLELTHWWVWPDELLVLSWRNPQTGAVVGAVLWQQPEITPQLYRQLRQQLWHPQSQG